MSPSRNLIASAFDDPYYNEQSLNFKTSIYPHRVAYQGPQATLLSGSQKGERDLDNPDPITRINNGTNLWSVINKVGYLARHRLSHPNEQTRASQVDPSQRRYVRLLNYSACREKREEVLRGGASLSHRSTHHQLLHRF